MKGFLKSKLVMTIAAFVMIAAATTIPLTSSLTHSQPTHAAATKAPFGIPTSGFSGFLWDEPLPGGGVHAGVDICFQNDCRGTAEGNEVRAAFGGTLFAIYNDQVHIPTSGNPVPAIVVMEHDNLHIPGEPATVFTWYLHMAEEGTSTTYVNDHLEVGQYYPAGTLLGHMGNRRIKDIHGLPIGDAVTHLHFQVQRKGTDLFFDNSLDPSHFIGLNVNFNKSGHLKRGTPVTTNLPGFGYLWVTGHDADFHCANQTPIPHAQCHYLKVALNFVMRGSPLPILALDHGHQVETAVAKAFSGLPSGVVAPTVTRVDPRSSAFTKIVNSLVDSHHKPRFSAIVVASDITCSLPTETIFCDNNEFTSTPDSDAINKQVVKLLGFVGAGGGALVLAGAKHRTVYYKFVGVKGIAVTPANEQPGGFKLTPVGLKFLLTDKGSTSDVNCCQTHNSFAPESLLQVVETDVAGKPETFASFETFQERT
jgi:murein DD-endopeptidase MepM/ murein hydrolase activator NlpD